MLSKWVWRRAVESASVERERTNMNNEVARIILRGVWSGGGVITHSNIWYNGPELFKTAEFICHMLGLIFGYLTWRNGQSGNEHEAWWVWCASVLISGAPNSWCPLQVKAKRAISLIQDCIVWPCARYGRAAWNLCRVRPSTQTCCFCHSTPPYAQAEEKRIHNLAESMSRLEKVYPEVFHGSR